MSSHKMLAPTLIVACSLVVMSQVRSTTANDLQQAFNEPEDNQNEDNFGQLAESLAISAVAAASGNLNTNLQCEKISFAFCDSMPYNFTRMPNFVKDSNQIEAAERAKQYEPLAKTHCSRHLLAYLCELLAPMCLDGDSMKRFEIYPCRSFCRQVRRDCHSQLNALYLRFNQQIPTLFACDLLPYEANGGDGAPDHGPCHELPDLGPPPRPAHNNPFNYNSPPAPPPVTTSPDPSQTYGPYVSEPDPFNPEDPRIDPNILRPVQPTLKQKNQADANNMTSNSVWLARIDATALKLAWTVLGILVMACLFLLLKVRLAASSASSRKSSSSASSSGSQRKLASSLAGANHKQAVSPSSSSRSLMLLAGGGHDKLQSNHLQSEGPSHKLLHQASIGQRTTLTNLSGSIERHAMHQQQQQEAIRYHLMQSLGGQNQLVPQHQYDYIQVANVETTPRHQQLQPKIADLDGFKPRRALHEAALRSSARKQHGSSLSSSSGASKMTPTSQRNQATDPSKLYSNILLSSPSHQVLLFADQTEQRSQAPFGAGPAPSWQPAPMHFGLAQQQHSADGGYDTPLVSHEQHQRSFQRRPSFGAGQAGSLSSSGRNVARARHQAHLLAQELGAEPASQTFANSFNSSASASESSASGAQSAGSSSSFSPPATIGKPQLQPRGGSVQPT